MCRTAGIFFSGGEKFIFLSNISNFFSAGSTVHILDKNNPDWWRGRCTITGSTGYLPSTYLTRTLPAERVFKVVSPCSLIRYICIANHFLSVSRILKRTYCFFKLKSLEPLLLLWQDIFQTMLGTKACPKIDIIFLLVKTARYIISFVIK